jgi:hypothetical protein
LSRYDVETDSVFCIKRGPPSRCGGAGNFGCRAFAASYNEKPLKTAAKARHLCVGLSSFKESAKRRRAKF